MPRLRKRRNAYPGPLEPEIPDHLWISLKLSLDGHGGDREAIRKTIKSFCTIFGVSFAAVERRFEEEEHDEGAAMIAAGATLH